MTIVGSGPKSGQVVGNPKGIQANEGGNGAGQTPPNPPTGPSKPEGGSGKPSSSDRTKAQCGIRTDGAVLIDVNDAKQHDLTGFELATYIVLYGEQAAEVLRRLSNAGDDAASHFVGGLPKKPA